MNTIQRSLTVACSTLSIVLATACTKPPPPRAPPTSSETSTTTAELPEEETSERCALNCGSASVIARPSTPDHHVAAVADADAVFRSMHDDLLACYRKRLPGRPNVHAFMTVDVIVKPDGSVGWIETTGGAHFGERGLKCITSTIEKAHFIPVAGGGTRRIHVPLTFRMLAPGEDI